MATPPTSASKAQVLAIQHYQAGNLREALDAAKEAADIDTSNLKLLNLVGAIANEIQDPATAIQYLNKSVQINPHQIEAQFLLGNAMMVLGMNEEAINAYDTALSLDPSHIFSYVNLSQCLDNLNRHSKAERALRRALAIAPEHPDVNGALAPILIRKTQYKDAEKHARIAVNAAPDKITFLLTLAKSLRHLNRHSEAEELYRAALAVHPHDAGLLVELGSTLREQNLFDEGKKHYETALKLMPRNTKVLRGAGSFYQSIKQYQKALDVYERYIELKPNDIGMLNNLAIVLRELNRFEEAEQYYLKCAEGEDNAAYVYNNLGILAMEMAKPEESIRYYKKALEHNPNYSGAHSNMLFYMNYLDSMSTEELFEEHKNWAKWHTDPLIPGADVFPNDTDPDRPIRIGYISADLYGHAVSYFIESALRHHDSSKFDVFCYANVTTPDGMTKKLQSYTNTWRFINKLKSFEIAELIRSDKIDILIDLSGHTAGNRLNVMALKPAPIQVTWIGYPNTTGLDTVDYRFVDAITDPEGEADKYHTETLYRLPRSFTCYNAQYPTEHSLELSALSTGQVTFGSFNNASKLSTGTIKTWARILSKVENSRLILKSVSLIDKGTQSRFHAMFESHGISADRVEMFGRMSNDEHMQFYGKIDIGLDPFPYNGTTTSCEALWMGVPIVAIAGDRHAARVTASLLTQVGLEDLIATDEDSYVEIAVDLANRLDDLANIRRNLRENMTNSPLCDHEGHTREVEDAYRTMWHKWCKDEDSRRKERASRGQPETEPHRPIVRLMHSLGNYSFVQFCKCIGAMDKTYLVDELHPLGTNIFPPLKTTWKRYGFFTEEERDFFTKKDIDFKNMIAIINKAVEEHGGNLVISDWCHLDFIAQPYLPAPHLTLMTNEYLEKMFDIKEVFVMRHPISQWGSFCRESNLDMHITVEEFLRGYRAMAEIAVKGMMIRCEDFVKNPDEILASACEQLALPYDPDYSDNWPFNLNVPPSAYPMSLEERADEVLRADLPTDVAPDMIERMKACGDYAAIIDLLGYE